MEGLIEFFFYDAGRFAFYGLPKVIPSLFCRICLLVIRFSLASEKSTLFLVFDIIYCNAVYILSIAAAAAAVLYVFNLKASSSGDN